MLRAYQLLETQRIGVFDSQLVLDVAVIVLRRELLHTVGITCHQAVGQCACVAQIKFVRQRSATEHSSLKRSAGQKPSACPARGTSASAVAPVRCSTSYFGCNTRRRAKRTLLPCCWLLWYAQRTFQAPLRSRSHRDAGRSLDKHFGCLLRTADVQFGLLPC